MVEAGGSKAERRGSMSKTQAPIWRRWGQFRFSVIGELLSSPPAKGQLQHISGPVKIHHHFQGIIGKSGYLFAGFPLFCYGHEWHWQTVLCPCRSLHPAFFIASTALSTVQ
jgi:hypothetical protein